MANVTIPNLPQVTATTDLDILVITDSGETTTSKITKSDFLSGVGGNLVDGTGSDSNALVGKESLATGQYSLSINPQPTNLHQASGKGAIHIVGDAGGGIYGGAKNEHSVAIGGFNPEAAGDEAAVIAGTNNRCRNTRSGVFVGEGNYAQGSDSVILGGQSHNINFSGARSAIVGGQGNIVGNNSDCFVGGGTSHNVTSNRCAVVGGTDNDISSGGNCFIGGGTSHDMVNASSAGIVGGQQTIINGCDYAGAIGGQSNDIFGTASVAVGGQSNVISATADYSVMLGGQSKTLTLANTAGMENGYVFSHFTYETYSGVSIGNEQLFDADNGMVQYFDNPAGNLNIRTVNVKNGEVYDMILGGAGGVSINSIGVNDVGFTAVDNTSAASGSYMHLRIAVVNDLVVFSTL